MNKTELMQALLDKIDMHLQEINETSSNEDDRKSSGVMVDLAYVYKKLADVRGDKNEPKTIKE